MTALAGVQTRSRLPPAIICISVVGVAVAVLSGTAVKEAALAVAVLTAVLVGSNVLFAWRSLLTALVLLIFFIPIKRYSFPASLPFELEPYRLFVAFLVALWGASLLVDRRIRITKTAFDGPVLLIAVAILASDLANPRRVDELGTYVAKDLLFFASFLLVVYLVASVIRSADDLDYVLKVMVGGGAVVALTLLFERRFLYNVFDHLEGVVPLLTQKLSVAALYDVEFRQQVIGSAQHPIAMGAATAILAPCAVYLAVSHSRRWWFAAVALGLGTLATAARTALVMITTAGIVLLILRWRELRRYLPALLPFAMLTWVAAPGAVGTLRSSFFPPGGLIAEQSTVVKGNEDLANNRLADIGPAMQEFSMQPLFGQGYGTRITGFYEPFINAAILDNQWLLTLLETGLLGIAAFVWLFVRVLRRLTRIAQTDEGREGWLAAALASSVWAFAVGMFTYDAFSFIQVAFLFFLLLALAAVLIRVHAVDSRSRLSTVRA